MSYARACNEGWSVDSTQDGGSDGETSGVFEVQRWPAVDIAVGEIHGVGSMREPAPVYAAPYMLQGKERRRYARVYYLGTRFATGIIEADGWDDEMRADGISEIMIAKCRDYVNGQAL